MRRPALRRSFAVRTLGLAALFFLASCFQDSTGPGEGRVAHLAIAPVFERRALQLVDFTEVHIHIAHLGAGGAAFDTTITFPAGADTLALAVSIPVLGSSERFVLTMDFLNALGETVFQAGPDTVTVAPGALSSAPITPSARYTGVGSNARTVRIDSSRIIVSFQDSLLLTAQAYDSNNVAIPGTPIAWVALDTPRVRVPDPARGRVIAGTSRGTARVVAQLLRTARDTTVVPKADTALVLVQPLPSAAAIVGGNSQTGTVGAVLGTPLAVKVTAVDGLGVKDVLVSFLVATGGGTLSAATASTNDTGVAAVNWTLGTTAGAQTVSFTVAGVASVPGPFAATATAGTATQQLFTVQPSNVNAGVAISPAVVVRVADAFGNTVTGFVGTDTMLILNNPGGASLGGTVMAPFVSGVATFASLTLNAPGTGYTLRAQCAAAVRGTSAAFNVVSVTPTQLAIVQQPTNATAGVALSPAITVALKDAAGNTVTTATDSVQLAIGTNPGTSVLSGTVKVAAVAGIATFSTVALNKTGTGYTLTATAAGLTGATSNTFSITPVTASVLVFTTQPPASAVAGAPFPVVVTARDGFGNTATAFAGAVTMAIGTNPGGGALSGTNPVSAVAGVATFSNLSINLVGVGYTLTASAAGPITVTSSTFDITAGAAVSLAFSTQPPASVIFQSPFAVTVRALDSVGNLAPGFTGQVSLGVAANAASGALYGTTAVNAVAGVATFSGISIDNIGTGYTIAANATGVSGVASTTVDVISPANANGWINVAGGNWSTAANWSRGTVPTATDTVFIRQTGTYTVNLDVSTTLARLDVGGLSGQQTLSIAATTLTMVGNGAFNAQGRLALSGGTVTGAGTLDVFGALTWSGGNFSGGGGTTRVQSGGTLSVSGSGTGRQLNSYALELGGTGTWNITTAGMNSGSVGTLRVLSGGQLDVTGDFGMLFNQGGVASRLAVQSGGTLRRTTSTGAVQFTTVVDDSGTVDVQAGTLQLDGGGTSNGSFSVAAGTTLQFGGGTHTLAAAGSVGGAGEVRISAGTVNAAGGWAVTSPTRVSGGALNYNNAAGGATGTLIVSSGTLGGTGLLQVSGSMTWSGGNLSGGGGATRVLGSGTLAVSGAGTGRQLNSYALELGGTGTWNITTAGMNSGSVGTLRVLSGGQLDVTGDFGMLFNQGGVASRLAVQSGGTLRRTTSTGAVQFTTVVDDSGTVDVQTGTLDLSGGGTSSGVFTAAGGTTLDFGGGTHSLGPTSTVSGVGTVQVSGGTVSAGGNWAHGGTTQVNGGTLSYSATGGSTTNLNVTAGTLSGAAGGLLGVSGTMTWSGGNLSAGGGTTRVLATGTLAVSGSGSGRQLNNYTLELAGTGTWATTTAIMNSGSGGTLRVLAGGQLDVTGDFGMLFNQGGVASRLAVQSGGTLRRTTSTGAVQFTTVVDDSGTVDVQAGTLQLDGGGTSNGSYVASGTGTLSFGGGTHNLSAASAFSGAGTAFVQIPGGTVNASGAWVNFGTTRVNGGTANFNGASMSTGALDVSSGTMGGTAGGLLDVTASMTWTGGNLTGSGGTTRVSGVGSLSISGTAARNLINYVLELGTSGGIWTGTHTINSGSGAVFRVLSGGLLDIRGDPTYAFNQGGAASQFDNQGTVLRSTSAGTATIDAAVTTSNLVNVSSGTLALTSGGTLGANMVANAPGVLSLTTGTFTMTNNLAFIGTGAVQLNGATMSGLVAGDSVRASVTSFAVNTGTLSPGTGATIKVTGNMNWANSATLSGGGKTLIATGGTVVFSGTTTRNLNNHILEIASSTGNNWTGALTMNSGSGAVLRVLPAGALNLQAPASFLYVLGGAVPLFENQGTLTSAPGAGTTFTTSAPFNNSGALSVTSGTLAVTNGGTQSGPVSLTSSTFFDFNGGTHTLNNGFTATGAGTARVQSGTITTGTALDTARFVTLQLNSGTLGQPGGVVVSGLLDWAGSAAIIGTGMTRLATGSLTLTGTATRSLQNGILDNRGTASWSGAFTMQTGSGAVFRNAAGGTFNWTADATFAYVLGGALPTFVNEGSLTVNTGSPALAARFSGNFVDTTGSLLSVTSGDLMMQNGGRIGGAPSIGAGAFLEVVGGTLSLKGGLTTSGTGNLRINGGTLTVDSGLTASVGNLELFAGAIAHEGLLLANGVFDWTAGNITSNTAGLGGTTRIPLGRTLNLLGTAGRNLSGTHVLEIAGTGVWSGTFFINTGSGSTLRVLAGGTLDVTATNPTISYNLGGAAPVLNNLGAITRSVGAAGWVVNVPVSGNGTWNITAGNLDMQGGGTVAGATTVGASTTLLFNAGTHTYTAPVTGTGIVNVNGGTVNLNTTMNIPTLTISAGTLVLGGQPVSVTGNFTTGGTGALSMTNAADSLDINGNASFGGGTGTLSNGVIRVAGNFTQVGAGAAYAPSPATGAHRVVLDGAAAQTVSFGSTVFSSFRRLEVNKAAGGVVLGSNVRASFFRMVSGTTLNGAFRLLTDTVYSPNFAHTIAPLVVEISAVLGDSGGSGFLPDTTVFTGANQSISPNNTTFLNYAYKSIRVAQSGGTATFPANLTVPNDLVVSSGPLDIGAGRTINVTGAFRTEGTGQLQMVSATGALVIAGNATFGGSSTGGVLTAGNLTVNGDFTQAGGSLNAFAPTVSHHTTLGGTGTQNISFANPTFSFFDALDVASTSPRNIVLQTNVLTNDSLIVLGGASQTTVVGAGTTQRLRVNGFLRLTAQTASPLVRPPVLELVQFPSVDSMGTAGGINPDTTVFLGGTTFPEGRPMQFKSVRVATNGVMTFSSSNSFADTLAGDLVVDGASTFAVGSTGFGLVVSGKLRTISSGVLRMQTAFAELTVADSAIFGGGSTNLQLTNGSLRLRGHLRQGGGNPAAFSATGAHQTEFIGNPTGAGVVQSISMANPGTGAALSHFNQLRLTRASLGTSLNVKLNLLTNVQAALVVDTSTGQNDSILGTGTVTLTTDSIQLQNTVFNNAPLVMSSSSAFISAGTLRFENMDPATTYLTVSRSLAGTSTFGGMTFATVPTTGTGRYFVVNQTAAAAVTVNFNNPVSPAFASMAGFYLRSGAPLPTVNWGGTPLP